MEAHLLDFDQDLYGTTIRVELGSLVRGQRSFETEDELVRQIASDIEAIRARKAETAVPPRVPGASPG